MQKRLCAFFKNAQGLSFILWVAASFAMAEESPSDVKVDPQKLLELPEYQVETLETLEGKSVGDEISIRFSGGLEVESVELPEGSSSFTDLGWQIYRKENPTVPGEFSWALSPLKSGDLVLPPILLRDASGKSFGRTAPFKSRIQSNLDPSQAEPPQPVPPRPPVDVEFPKWILFLIVVGGLLVLLGIGYAIYRWSKNRPEPVEPLWVAPEKSCEQMALEALSLLEGDDWSTADRVKANSFRLTEILKNYIERKFGFGAPESTTTEVVTLMRQSCKMPEANYINLAELLLELDQIKFTDYASSNSQGKDLIQRSRTWIRTISPLNPLGGPRM